MRIRYGLIAFDVQKSIDFEASMSDVKSVLEIALGELFRGQFWASRDQLVVVEEIRPIVMYERVESEAVSPTFCEVSYIYPSVS